MVSTGTLILFGTIGALLSNGSLSISTFLWFLLAFAVFVLFSLYKCQEQMLYQPKVFPQFIKPSQNPPGFRSPDEHGLPYENVELKTRDGLTITAWFIRSDGLSERKERPTILFFHANAGNMGFRLENIKMMYNTLGCNVFILSYRGYGDSEGQPTEQGLQIDAETAWEYLLNREDIDKSKIIIFGRSLGGSVAIYLAHRYSSQVCCLVIENTFLSIPDMADALFPFLRIPYLKEYLLKIKWPARERIGSITCPILFLSGMVDEVVPPSHMVRLHELAVKSSFKKFLSVKNGQHNNTWTEGGIAYIDDFLFFINKFAHGIDGNSLPKVTTNDTFTVSDKQNEPNSQSISATNVDSID